MEAPEKIYLTSDEKNSYVFTRKRSDNMGVEYIRTDAFIEKACDAYCKVCGHYAHTTPNHICRQACDYYRNLSLENINHIKGILSFHKPQTQIIAVIHNPLLIYNLSSNKDINFIEMNRGYIKKVKKEVDNLIKK